MAVIDLGFDIACMVVIASKHVPGDFERLCRVNRLKCILVARFRGEIRVIITTIMLYHYF